MEQARINKVYELIKSGKTFDESWKEAGFKSGGGRIHRLKKQLIAKDPDLFRPTKDHYTSRINTAQTKDAIDEVIVELGEFMVAAKDRRKKIK